MGLSLNLEFGKTKKKITPQRRQKETVYEQMGETDKRRSVQAFAGIR